MIEIIHAAVERKLQTSLKKTEDVSTGRTLLRAISDEFTPQKGEAFVWSERKFSPIKKSWISAIHYLDDSGLQRTRLMFVAITNDGPTFCWLHLNHSSFNAYSSMTSHNEKGEYKISLIQGFKIPSDKIKEICKRAIAACPSMEEYLDKNGILSGIYSHALPLPSEKLGLNYPQP